MTDNKPRSTLNIAFVGGAYHSPVGRVHRIATQMDNRFNLVAGCFSRTASQNEQTAGLYGLSESQVCESFSELINRKSEYDAIVILTPTTEHQQQIVESLNAGIPVISEKALVTSADAALSIRQQLSASQGFLTVTYNYTGYPMLRELKRLIGQGKLGKLEQIHIEMPQEGFSKVDAQGKPIVPQSWRLQDGLIPTVSLDLGVHVHSIIKFLSNEKPLEVVSTTNTFGNFNQIADTVSCIAHYTNQLLCNIWYCKTALGHRNGLKVRVYGTKGSLEWCQDNSEYLMFADNQGRKAVLDRAHLEMEISNQLRYNRFKSGHPAGFIEAFANSYYDIADALSAHLNQQPFISPYVFGIEDALEGLRMLEAMSISASNRQWVKCDD